jgi:hypothetical protein
MRIELPDLPYPADALEPQSRPGLGGEADRGRLAAHFAVGRKDRPADDA